jgi:hypothetical protein
MLEMDCVLNELRHQFEVGETENTDYDWEFFVKHQTMPLPEMEQSARVTLEGHYGLIVKVLATKSHPQQGNVLKLRVRTPKGYSFA